MRLGRFDSVPFENNTVLGAYTSSILIFISVFIWALQVPIEDVTVNIYTLLALLLTPLYIRQASMIVSVFALSIVLIAIVFLQYASGVDSALSMKTFATSITLAVVTIFSIRLLVDSSRNEFQSLFSLLKYGIYIMLVLQIIQISLMNVGIYNSEFNHYFLPIDRPFGFFLEPSHIGFSLAPMIYFLFAEFNEFKKRMGVGAIWALLLIIFLCPSFTTILAVILSVAVGIMRGRRKYREKVALVLIFGGAVSGALLLQPVQDRIVDFLALALYLDPTGDENGSVILFLKGWDMATQGLQTHVFGVGVLNYSYLNNWSSISYISDFFYHANSHGGTAIINKGLGEFGLFFIIMIIYSLFIFLGNILRPSNDIFSIVENMFIFAFFVALYRGASYFDSSPLIGLSIILGRLVKFRLEKARATAISA